MIKFEIHRKSIEADTSKIAHDPTFRSIIINKGYFGLFVGIKYYNEYIIQEITYEEPNQPNISPPFSVPKIIKPTNNGNALSDVGLTCSAKKFRDHDCVPDEKPDIGLFLDTSYLYKDTLTTEDSCLNSCSGKGLFGFKL